MAEQTLVAARVVQLAVPAALMAAEPTTAARLAAATALVLAQAAPVALALSSSKLLELPKLESASTSFPGNCVS